MGFVKLKQQKGLALVEFAIALPFLILLLSVMGEIGYLLYQQTSLNKSIENGAVYASKNTRLGTGLIKIDATTEQNAKNLIIYGNLAGTGDKLINNINIEDISLTCTYGTEDGYCEKDAGVTAITLQANVNYIPVMGSLFDNVTGFTLFPLSLSATSTVTPI